MSDGPAADGQWEAGRRAVLDRITAARDHLTAAVENVLYDLGQVGHKAARDILTEISDELDEVEQLLGAGDG